MKNFYEILGVSKQATLVEIKQAYRALALINHPDKGGDPEMMSLLTDAYDTLKDSDKRFKFDEDWQTYNLSLDEVESIIPVSGYLTTTGVAYSKTFKDQHAQLAAEYRQKPLVAKKASSYFKAFTSNLYGSVEGLHTNNIFSWIKQKEKTQGITPSYLYDELTPVIVIDILIKFLQGDLYGPRLRTIYHHFSRIVEMANALEESYHDNKNILLYEGVHSILKLAITNEKLTSNLLQAIQKITDYAKQDINTSIGLLAPLFQNKYFRNLFSQALHRYWLSNEDALKEDDLKAFDGQESAKTLIQKLKEQLLQNRDRDPDSDHTNKMVRYARMLYKLEKDIQQPADDNVIERAKWYRKKAYLILDWIPALLATSAKSIICNTFIQAAVYLQQASACEKVPSVSMSDQKIALRLYLMAIGVAHYITPDVELYVLVQCLKYTANFQYGDPELAEIIPAFQRRTLVIADIFPFFQTNQSNIDFLRQEDKPVILMRQLLHAYIAMIDAEKARNEKSGVATKSAIDHSYVTVFYQVYEACLNNWYEEKYDPETEKNFRIKLMRELLAINRWTFFDLNFNLESPWLMIKRDASGWMQQSRELPFPKDNKTRNFSAINGLE